MNPAEPADNHHAPPASADAGGAGAMLSGDAVARLGSLAVLRASGADALAFLQGQLTVDVDEVGPAASRLAAWCSPKGRVLAMFRLFADPAGDGYLLVCERWFVAKLLARLRMFILRADARVDDVSGEIGVAGIAGTCALPDRAAAWARAADVDDAATFEETAIARVPGRHRRFIVAGPHVSIASVAAPRDDRVRRTGDGAWRLADICAGVTPIGEDTSDTFLPQMLNLDRLRAVSFEKGCYVGQEIVARTQHLGRIKRRACVGRTDAAIAAGDPDRGRGPRRGSEGRRGDRRAATSGRRKRRLRRARPRVRVLPGVVRGPVRRRPDPDLDPLLHGASPAESAHGSAEPDRPRPRCSRSGALR